MSKATIAIIAAAGAATGAAATAALYSLRRAPQPSPPITTTTTTTVSTPPRTGPPAPYHVPSAVKTPPIVDPNGLFQYGFPGPGAALKSAASLPSSFDRRTRNPFWVAEHITPESLATHNGDRKHSVFVED